MPNYTVTREDRFIGYNDRLPSEELPPRYLADALNCFCGTDEAVKRKGYTLVANDIGTNVACGGIRGIQWADGTKELFAVFNGGVYKWTGSGNWSSLGGTLSTTAQVDIVMANNALYFFDGINTVVKYPQGGAITTVGAIPIGKYAKWFHNQLHVAGMSATPNTLQSSDVGNPEQFSSGITSTLGINPNDGDYITGLGILKDQLFIFKTKRIWSLSGTFGTATLTLSSLGEVSSNLGTYAYRSIINIGNELLFMSFFGGQPHIRSIMRTLYGIIVDNGIVSLAIEGTMNRLNTAKFSTVASVFDGRYVWFALANGSSTTNNIVLIYDTIKKGWTRHTGINASALEVFTISTTPQIYFGDSTALSKVYVFDGVSTSDNGVAINYSITSRRYGGNQPEHKNKWKRFYIRTKESGNFNLTLDYSLDGFEYGNLATVNMGGTGSVFDNITLDTSRIGSTDLRRKSYNIPKARNYYIQFKMYETSSTSSITVRNWDLLSQKKDPIIDN